MYTKDGSNLVPVPSNAVIPERDINEMPALECKNLGITFGGLHAVENFNLTIGKTEIDRKSTRLNSSHPTTSRMPSSA